LSRLNGYQASSLPADRGWPQVSAVRRQSEKRGKILDFYFLLRHCRPDSLQIVKMLD
jgi:hypothetical protein